MWKTRVTQLSVYKKNLSSLSCQWTAEESHTTVSCNNSVVWSNRLFRWQVNRKTKEHVSMPDGRQAKKVPASLTWWPFSEVLEFLAGWSSADSRIQQLTSDKFDQWQIRRRMCRQQNQREREIERERERFIPLHLKTTHGCRIAVCNNPWKRFKLNAMARNSGNFSFLEGACISRISPVLD